MKTDYRALCEELLKHLEWYIENDDTNEGETWEEKNAYWLKGKRDAMEVVSRTKESLRKEVEESETRKEMFNTVMNSIPSYERYRWCTAGACACMGCANYYVLKAGFTQKDHQEWVRRNPPTNPTDAYWAIM